MIGTKSLLYYSANSYLSYHINRQFYSGQHYVWCSPVFDPTSLDKFDPRRRIPPSSSPKNIYYSYLQDADCGDNHSALISQNRAGIKRGATHKLAEEIISASELQMINEIVDSASAVEFRPLLYLIPESVIKEKIQKVSVSAQANPLSTEYIVDNLMDGEFEIIELNK